MKSQIVLAVNFEDQFKQYQKKEPLKNNMPVW